MAHFPDANKISKNRIALISTPWPLFNRPSIQLGTLKSFLKKEAPDVQVSAHHFYLQAAEAIGYQVYRKLSERTWLAETVYGGLLHPERFDKIESLFQKQTKGKALLKKQTFDHVVSRVEKVSRDFITNVDWSQYVLAGFSLCLCQLTSSLYFMREIKRQNRNLINLAGGSLLSAGAAKAMLDRFPQIDAIIVGEGERPLAKLLGNLKKYQRLDKVPPSEGIVTRNSGESHPSFCQLADLEEVPRPDFQDYFDLLATFSPQKKFFPSLPVEISRGCYHRLKEGKNGERGCAFCNLNLQWEGYRIKKTEQAVSEIENLTSKHKLLSVNFMDNAVSPKRATAISDALSLLKKDFKIFGEFRAAMDEKTMKSLYRAGVNEIQVGIEALSSNLLKRMNKGTTAIQNLEVMKHCESFSIANIANLILHFPGSSESDVEKTLRAISFAQVFRPLKIVYFWLGLESPVYVHHKAFGIDAVFNHPNYRILFPREITDHVKFIIQDYRGDKLHQRRLWKPVEKAAASWKKNYFQLHESPGAGPILSYRDGRDFMIIRRRRLGEEDEIHRLTGTSRKIYLFCSRARSIEDILQNFQRLSEKKLFEFLEMMIQKKLMFGEDEKFLSLAVPLRDRLIQ